MARWVFEARSCRRVSASRKNRDACSWRSARGRHELLRAGQENQLGPMKCFEDPMSGRRQVMMMNAHFVRSTFLVYLMNCQRTTLNNNVTLPYELRSTLCKRLKCLRKAALANLLSKVKEARPLDLLLPRFIRLKLDSVTRPVSQSTKRYIGLFSTVRIVLKVHTSTSTSTSYPPRYPI